MARLIRKEMVGNLLEKLSGYEVFLPVREKEGTVRFKPLGAGEPALAFGNSQKPPKEVFFPQTERMFDIEQKEGSVEISEPELPESPIILLGVRPCDARSFISLDRLMNWDYVDPYFVQRRQRTTIVSFACVLPDMPAKDCFCTSLEGSPHGKEGSDMLWTDVGDAFLVEALTDKGEGLLELCGEMFTDASEEQEAAGKEACEKAEKAIIRRLDTNGVPEALEKMFDSDYWNEFSARCLGCGICTLLCPTCHCFDINDVVKGGKTWRERTWDSCQYPYYTLHASGHNPRPEKRHRQRNRIYHKYLNFQKKIDEIGCVGCGRCIRGCPVNIDIIEVVEGVKGIGGGE